MWPRRTKSKARIHNAPSPKLFTCSSFKDITSLVSGDHFFAGVTPPSSLNHPSKPSICHRIRTVNALLRTFSQPHLRINVPEPEPDPEIQSINIVAEPIPDPRIQFRNNVAELKTDPGIQLCKNVAELEPDPEIQLGKNVAEPDPELLIRIPGAEQKVVVYFTSLRVVRPTFEDCKAVRSILRGFLVSIDERDVSMDSQFTDELRNILGHSDKLEFTLPRVFIGGRYIGGAEDVRRLNECGELKKYMEGLPSAPAGVCEACGGYRFLLCTECNGSHKCYSDKAGFRSCTLCNENGLIRCTSCSCAPL